jgi:hypothetical protein
MAQKHDNEQGRSHKNGSRPARHPARSPPQRTGSGDAARRQHHHHQVIGGHLANHIHQRMDEKSAQSRAYPDQRQKSLRLVFLPSWVGGAGSGVGGGTVRPEPEPGPAPRRRAPQCASKGNAPRQNEPGQRSHSHQSQAPERLHIEAVGIAWRPEAHRRYLAYKGPRIGQGAAAREWVRGEFIPRHRPEQQPTATGCLQAAPRTERERWSGGHCIGL